jgi:multicomponent K+:H+ antiporter subunit E
MRRLGSSLVLLCVWLALNQSVSPGQVALGLVIALAVPYVTARITVAPPIRIRRPGLVLQLTLRVLVDVVAANFSLARRTLGPEARLRSQFVWVPLRLRTPQGIATLATIVSLTPGTVSSMVSEDRRHLLVHVFHLDDESALLATIRERFERPLQEILEC